MWRIILPQLENKSVYIEEMLMIGVCNNEDVDLRAVSLIAANPKHWICINFCRRLQAICDIRRICGQNRVASSFDWSIAQLACLGFKIKQY